MKCEKNMVPEPDPKTVQESLEAFRRGEYQTTEEVVAELKQKKEP